MKLKLPHILLAAAVLTGAMLLWILWPSNSAKTVGIVYAEQNNPENTPYRQALEQALTDAGYKPEIYHSGANQQTQLEYIRQLSKDCDALIVEPVMISAGAELSQALTQADLPAVLIGRQTEGDYFNENKQVYFVGSTTPSGAAQSALLQALPQGGDVNGNGTVSYMILTGPDTSPEALARAGSLERYLDGELLTAQHTDWTADNSKDLCAAGISAYGKDVEVIFCCGTQITCGAAQAVQDSRRIVDKDVYIIGFDDGDAIAEQIGNEAITAAIVSDSPMQIDAVITAIGALLDGKTPAPVSFSYKERTK